MKVALINAALVGTGGFIGAIARYGVSGLVQRSSALSTFPLGTLAVNMLGCLLIGIAVIFYIKLFTDKAVPMWSSITARRRPR